MAFRRQVLPPQRGQTIKPGPLGLGDVKLVAMVGSFLGLRGALLTLILGSISGSVIGYSYIRLTGKDASSYELPFGTFLGAAALGAAIAGTRLLPL